jgi:hypothetical protein
MQYTLFTGIGFGIPHPLSIHAPKSIASHPTWVARKQLVRDECKARKEANKAMLEAGPPASKHGKLLSVATRHYINCLRKDAGATLEHDQLVNEDFRSTMSPEMLATAPPAIKGTWNNTKEACRFFKKARKERAALHLPGPCWSNVLFLRVLQRMGVRVKAAEADQVAGSVLGGTRQGG